MNRSIWIGHGVSVEPATGPDRPDKIAIWLEFDQDTTIELHSSRRIVRPGEALGTCTVRELMSWIHARDAARALVDPLGGKDERSAG